jgi:N-acetylglucosaminyldiphosphoundecaprenol N-acetyl-beta-D-mannosaminyltransferase
MDVIEEFAVAEPLPAFHEPERPVEALPRKNARGSSRPPVPILGVPFDQVTIGEAVQIIGQMIESRRPHYVVTPNVDFLVQAMGDAALHRILFNADLVVCDGMPLVWASRWMGNPLPERVAGADLVPRLIEVAEQKGHRLFLLGATPEANEQAVANLRRSHPRLVVAGYYSPPFRPLLEMNHEEIAARIREAKPDLLLVCFGCPKQEKWIAMNYRSLGVPVVMGVGATIDFLAGRVRRAPKLMQQTGTEWVFRLAQEPRRLFRRYLMDLRIFGVAVAAQWWQLKMPDRNWLPRVFMQKQTAPPPEHPAGVTATVTLGADWHHIEIPRRFDVTVVHHNAALWEQVATAGRHCLLSGSGVEFMDSAALGVIISLHKRLLASGWQLVLINPSPRMRSMIAQMRLQGVLTLVEDVAAAGVMFRAQRPTPAVEAAP